MSTIIMSKCWPLAMPPTPKAVLISLADNANDHGTCWPSIPTIAMRTCFSERAVQNAIKWLEKNGALKADRTNGRHTNYVVTPEGYSQPPQDMHPRTSVTGAGDAPPPAGGASVPPQEIPKPPHQVPSNRKEPSGKPSKNRQAGGAAAGEFDALKFLTSREVPEKIAKDWLKLRKQKHLPPTETAFDGVVREAELAKLSLSDAVRTCCERGWGGFMAKWLEPEPPRGVAAAGRIDPNAGKEWWEYETGIREKGKALKVAPQGRDENFVYYRNRVYIAAGQGPWMDWLRKQR